MSIKEILEKIKPFYPLFLALVLGSIFFALGRISVLEERREPIRIENVMVSQTAAIVNTATSSSSIKSDAPVAKIQPVTVSSKVIGSKSGKKYYFPWCGTVKRILPQNQVHFESAEEAKKAGFTPGGNCKGLK